MAVGTLITTGRVTRDELADIPTPDATPTWTPVPHAELVDRVEKELRSQGIAITSQEYGVQGGGAKLFGVLTVNYAENQERTAAIGLRAANDKSLAIQICVGAKVLVCENMAFSGDVLALSRKHTSGLQLELEIRKAISTFTLRYAAMDSEFEQLKHTPVSEADAKALMVDAVCDKQIVPVKYLQPIYEEYFRPRFEEHQPGSMYSLNQAFTYALRELPPNRRIAANLKVGRYFGLHQKR